MKYKTYQKPTDQQTNASRAGFGLAETLVAIGLFSIIVTIAVGGFSRALRSQRQAAALLLANSNVSITIEQMAREMRTGYNFTPGTGISEMSFTNARGERIYYKSEDNAVQRKIGLGSYEKITADNVVVQHLGFDLSGYQSGDGKQPRVTVTLGVSTKEVDLSGNIINLQTTISPRLPLDT
ncbi:MAG: type II secretion system protein [Candidatus Liptonbacteria bacterium]